MFEPAAGFNAPQRCVVSHCDTQVRIKDSISCLRTLGLGRTKQSGSITASSAVLATNPMQALSSGSLLAVSQSRKAGLAR